MLIVAQHRIYMCGTYSTQFTRQDVENNIHCDTLYVATEQRSYSLDNIFVTVHPKMLLKFSLKCMVCVALELSYVNS